MVGAVPNFFSNFFAPIPGSVSVRGSFLSKEFTVSIATEGQLAACDYVGIVSGNDTPDKVAKSGLHTHKAAHVDAPVVDELPLVLECRLVSYEDEHCHLFGDIVCTSADESILTDGKVDVSKLRPLIFDIESHNYWSFGEVAGPAFKAGQALK